MTERGVARRKIFPRAVFPFFCSCLFSITSSCTPLRASPDSGAGQRPLRNPSIVTSPPSVRELSDSINKSSPEELQGDLATYGENWLYGEGFGNTLLNVGTVVIFPPYALYLLGNAGLALAGYEPVYITDALPDTPREEILSVYGHVASIPGNVAAKIAGRESAEQETTVQE